MISRIHHHGDENERNYAFYGECADANANEATPRRKKLDWTEPDSRTNKSHIESNSVILKKHLIFNSVFRYRPGV